MVSSSTLETTIRELGEEVLVLENGFDLMRKFNRQSALEIVDKFSKLDNLFSSFRRVAIAFKDELHNRLPKAEGKFSLPEQVTTLQEYSLVLALQLVDHDLGSTVNHSSYLLWVMEQAKDSNIDRKIASLLEEGSCFANYEATRILLASIPYIATADPKFRMAVNTETVPSLVQAVDLPKDNSYNFNAIQTISSDEYLAGYQLLKNARMILSRAKIEGSVDLEIQDGGTLRLITVADTGTGIEPDVLPVIFGTYSGSDHGTGIGLQIVKRIVELRGGRAVVTSTVNKGDTFQYDIESATVQLIEQRTQGTSFELYLPQTE